MVPDTGAALFNPHHVLIGLGALAALLAAPYWWQVANGQSKLFEREGWKVRRAFGFAALLTGTACALVPLGYLLGRFTGKF